MSNNQPLADMLLAAGEKSGDRCWQLPLSSRSRPATPPKQSQF